MKDDAFRRAIDALGTKEVPRVWSLIVTVFGDLAQQSGDAISGPVLGDILSPIGVRPEAMRVALHRLRNEGWIETTKRGREALHALSVFGSQQSALASQKIYASENIAEPVWHIHCCAPALIADETARAKTMEQEGYVTVAPGIYLRNGALRTALPDALSLQGSIGEVPDWLGDALASKVIRAAFDDLAFALKHADLKVEDVADFSALQTATLRTLIVHRWRKLVLKLPYVPDALFGTDFEGVKCRIEVMRALSILKRPETSSLARSTL